MFAQYIKKNKNLINSIKKIWKFSFYLIKKFKIQS